MVMITEDRDSVWQFWVNLKKKFLVSTSCRQFATYSIIGILTNAIGYLFYLTLTYFWEQPKLAMTILYCLGATLGFFSNRRFSFKSSGHIGAQGVRYLISQFLGYLLNLLILIMFVDWIGFPHEYVQIFAVIIVAVCLFVLLRFFVFAEERLNEKVTIK